jgi:hypothetical protein
MRTVLISTILLLCAAPMLAQDTQPDIRPGDPASRMARQSMVGQQELSSDKSSPALAEVPPDTPVVTLEGVCDQPQPAGAKGCKTVITRAQIDNLIDMQAPSTPAAARRAYALSYARQLAASGEAQRQHLDKDPAVAAELKAQIQLARIRVLSAAFYHQLEQRVSDVPDSEVQKYYTEHNAEFAEGEVRRLTIPKSALTKMGHPIDPLEAKARTDELKARATAGEDFDQLQHEVYLMFEVEATPPPTKVSTLRRMNLPPDQAKVFDLKVGEISQWITSPEGFDLLKLEAKRPVPIDLVRAEIESRLQRQRKAQELETAAKDVKAEFNLAYLGVPAPPDIFQPATLPQLTGAGATVPDPLARPPVRRRMPMNTQGLKGFPPLQQ